MLNVVKHQALNKSVLQTSDPFAIAQDDKKLKVWPDYPSRHKNRFNIYKFMDAEHPQLAAIARLFDAAKGQARV